MKYEEVFAEPTKLPNANDNLFVNGHLRKEDAKRKFEAFLGHSVKNSEVYKEMVRCRIIHTFKDGFINVWCWTGESTGSSPAWCYQKGRYDASEDE